MRIIWVMLVLGGCGFDARPVVDGDAGVQPAPVDGASGAGGLARLLAQGDGSSAVPELGSGAGGNGGGAGISPPGADVASQPPAPRGFAGGAAPIPTHEDEPPTVEPSPEPTLSDPADAGTPDAGTPDAAPIEPTQCMDVAPIASEPSLGYVVDCGGAECTGGQYSETWCEWHPTMDPIVCAYYVVMWEPTHVPHCWLPRGHCGRARNDDGECYVQGDHASFQPTAVRGRGWVEYELADAAAGCPLRCP